MKLHQYRWQLYAKLGTIVFARNALGHVDRLIPSLSQFNDDKHDIARACAGLQLALLTLESAIRRHILKLKSNPHDKDILG